MYITGNDTFVEAQFDSRLRDLFGDAELNGTPVVEPLYTAINVDRRLAGVELGALLELTTEAVIDACGELFWLLHSAEGGGSIDLPFGTVATNDRPGGVKIGHQMYVLDAGRPGLHEVEMVDSAARGLNLDRLQARIAHKTRKLACRRLGVPAGAFVCDNTPRQLLQFPPCEEIGGVVLQRQAYDSGAERFCAATAKQIDAFADSIVADMRKLWTGRKIVGTRVAEIRAIAEQAVLEADRAHPVSLRAIAVDMSWESGTTAPSLYVEFNGLDEALRAGTILDYAPSGFDDWAPRTLWGQKYRHEDAAALKQQGADARIDDVAAAIRSIAPDQMRKALAALTSEQEARFSLSTETGPMHVTLYWHEGMIEAEASCPGKFEWCKSSLETHGVVHSEDEAEALIGQVASEVVDLPFELASQIIKAEALFRGGFRFKVPVGHKLVNLTFGRIW